MDNFLLATIYKQQYGKLLIDDNEQLFMYR